MVPRKTEPCTLRSDPGWRADYLRNLSACRAVAKSVPLIHVCGRFDELLASHVWALKPSSGNRSRIRTIEAEAKCELGNCVYLFSGRACPDFGDVIFAFSVSAELNQTGSATPFDSGGMLTGRIACAAIDEEDRVALIKSQLIPITLWRKVFARHVAAYFADPGQFWTGRPYRPDAYGIMLDVNNTFRAWTFEVRFQVPQAILEAERWCTTEENMLLYAREAAKRTSQQALLVAFHAKAVIAESSISCSAQMDKWSMETCKLDTR